MSDKKAKTVYLMVECRVDVPLDQDGVLDDQEIVDEVKELLWVCMANSADAPDEWGRSLVFHWGETPIIMDAPKVLPDDIKDILKRDDAKDASLLEQLRQAIIEENKRPSHEQFMDMVARGVINHKGEVLLKGPGCDDDAD